MLPRPVDLEILIPTREYIVNRVREVWLDSGRDCGPFIGALPTGPVAGKVDRLATDGPFGWMRTSSVDASVDASAIWPGFLRSDYMASVTRTPRCCLRKASTSRL